MEANTISLHEAMTRNKHDNGKIARNEAAQYFSFIIYCALQCAI